MRAGTTVADRFVIEREAVSAGLSSLYFARDLQVDGARVALKVVRTRGDGNDRFVREAEALRQLDHPAIVGYIDHGYVEPGVGYVAMQWIEGEDLRARLRRSGLDVRASLQVAERLASALGHAHVVGLLHRDVKPENVLLPEGDPSRAMLVDFGIVRDAAARSVTVQGSLVGTPGYMAPEQARAEGELDARVDVFALGAVLYECLTGRAPFTDTSVMATLARVLVADPAPFDEVAPHVPAEVRALVLSLLEKKRESRPADGTTVFDLIRAVQGAVRDSLPALGAVGAKPIPSLTSDESRLVCVVLVGSAQTSLGADAATIDAIPNTELSERLLSLAQSSGALVEPMGSALIATFALGRAIDDHAAARFALAAKVLVGDSVSVVFTLGRARSNERAPAEAIDRALRLSGASEEDPKPAVRIDETAAALLDRAFEWRSEEGACWLLGERGEEVRAVLGQRTPLVGRDRERAVLSATLQGAEQEHIAATVLVSGVAGVGKSRLVGALLEDARSKYEASVVVLRVRCDGNDLGSPWSTLARLVATEARIDPRDAPAQRRAKVSALLASLDVSDDRETCELFLSECVRGNDGAAASPALTAARSDPRVMSDGVAHAFGRWVGALLATRCAALLVLDDAHHADAASLQVLDRCLLRAKDAPLMLVLVGRPTLAERTSSMAAARNATAIALGPLSKRASEQVLRRLSPNADDASVEAAMERAQGNPFFLEEMARALVAGESRVPETVLALVEARLSALSAEARRVLRAASVYGVRFQSAGVYALLGEQSHDRENIRATLRALELRELVVRSSTEESYAFTHELLRDAAYATLLDADRTLGHRLAARWYASQAAPDASAIAAHFLEADDLQGAGPWLLRAAERARSAGDAATVLSHCERAERCAMVGVHRGNLLRLRVWASLWRGDNRAVIEASPEALALLPAGTAGAFDVLGRYAVALSRSGDNEPLPSLLAPLLAYVPPTYPDDGDDVAPEDLAMEPAVAFVLCGSRLAVSLLFAGRIALADEVFAAVKKHAAIALEREPGQRGHYLGTLAIRAKYSGDFEEFIHYSDEALASFELARDRTGLCGQSVDAGNALLLLGDYEAAEGVLRGAIEVADGAGLAVFSGLARHNLGLVLAHLRRFAEARHVERAAIERSVDNEHLRVASLCYLASIERLAGDQLAAEHAAGEALEAAKYPAMRAYALAERASVTLADEPDAALRDSTEAMRIRDGLGALEENDVFTQLTHCRALLACDRRDEALALLGPLAAAVRARIAAVRDERRRRAIEERVPEHAEVLALERALAL